MYMKLQITVDVDHFDRISSIYSDIYVKKHLALLALHFF